MNHKIKIKDIEVELTEEQIIELHSRLQNKGEKYFFPKEEATYYFMQDDGYSMSVYEKDEIDDDRIARGTFCIEAQAKREDDKRLALVRMWKWVQENGLYGEPDFSNQNVAKYYSAYVYSDKEWSSYHCHYVRSNFLFPHFKSESDCQKFIDNNLSDLNLFV